MLRVPLELATEPHRFPPESFSQGEMMLDIYLTLSYPEGCED